MCGICSLRFVIRLTQSQATNTNLLPISSLCSNNSLAHVSFMAAIHSADITMFNVHILTREHRGDGCDLWKGYDGGMLSYQSRLENMGQQLYSQFLPRIGYKPQLNLPLYYSHNFQLNPIFSLKSCVHGNRELLGKLKSFIITTCLLRSSYFQSIDPLLHALFPSVQMGIVSSCVFAGFHVRNSNNLYAPACYHITCLDSSLQPTVRRNPCVVLCSSPV